MLRILFLIILKLTSSIKINDKVIILPSFISSNMVFQHSTETIIWGYTQLDDITITLYQNQKQKFQQTVSKNAEKQFVFKIPSQEPGSDFKIYFSYGEEILKHLENIAFGNVYFCSGQSNMEFSVNQSFNADQFIKNAEKYSQIRLFDAIEQKAKSSVFDIVSRYTENSWQVTSQDYLLGNNTNFSFPSAVCFYTGVNIMQIQTNDIPIGLVSSTWGGTSIKQWSSKDALNDKTCGHTNPTNLKLNYTDLKTKNNDQILDGELFYGQISPFLQMKFKAVFWYQGEQDYQDPESYKCRFPAMIYDWRQKFNQDFQFNFVQLCTDNNEDFSELRLAQLSGLKLKNVNYATAFDLGDKNSTSGVIHPRNKFELGRRLAINYLFGYQAPIVQQISYNEQNKQLTIELTNNKNLFYSNTSDCQWENDCCDTVSPFEVLVNGEFKRVNFEIKDDKIIINNVQLGNLRYAYGRWPGCAIYNYSYGIQPLSPFYVESSYIKL